MPTSLKNASNENNIDLKQTKNELEVSNGENEQKSQRKLKYQLSKWRLFLKLWFLWRLVSKAKKMTKRIKTDPNSYSEEYRYNWIKKKVVKLLKIPNVALHVFGIENWLDRGVVLAPNHQSNADPLILLAINDFQYQQPLSFIPKQELWTSKIYKHFMNLIDNVPLDRNSPRSALRAMKEAKELINEYKRSVVVFPEGTRSQKAEMNEFHGASMKLAQMAYVPIVPVTIIDTYKLYYKRKKRLDIKVIFGKPMMPDKFISIKTELLTQNVKKEVQKNMDKYLDFDVHSDKNPPKKVDKKRKIYYY
ncbi:1-acyl-sn-glycerol-3-phosphate acyltransferase [Spiroplasma helicoides]|uniref:1-acyl-sn-glycerol-3-phosphate acyltransferase n=1 Tax=Spiroplasma helicoides TaxID=216938 RepID=A0A1B3SL45_9MOLU|nr:lysophospholipid acyltransferase family protein [Spiroplasma helicoides]AOG60645.1 1-acyl-sn-glycerol-3-phosphate acyltransferase [Spiroplasma helicoides]